MPYLTGFLGLMPLDQSILFEAGGRISNGEVPFRDIHLPYGLVPSFSQALFFKIFGIRWFVYVTHAAVFNGLFALIVFECLKILLPQSKIKDIGFASLLAAWAFYPMMGTPFLDNHSLFFSLAAWWVCLAAFKKQKYFLLLLVFPLMVLGFYSKPLPVVFWILPLLLECWFHKDEWKQWASWLGYGTAIAVFLLILPAFIFPADSFFYYSYLLPFQLGQQRFSGNFPGNSFEKLNQFKLLVLCLVPVLFFFRYKFTALFPDKKIFFRLVLLVIITVLSGLFTLNDFYNVTTPVFVAVFFVFDVVLRRQEQRGYYRFASLFLWAGLIAGISYLNFSRKINHISFNVTDLNRYSPDIKLFLRTPYVDYSVDDVMKLKNHISKGRSFYIGDLLFLYSLAGQKNPWPITHIHDGTTYNSSDTAHYSSLQKHLLQNLIKMKADILIRDSTWWINESFVYYADQFKGRKKDSFGVIAVYEIDTSKLYKAARSLNINFEK